MLLFAVLASTARGYAWASIVAAVLAWLVGGVLMRYGDRGVATGVALAAGTGLSIAGIVVVVHLAQGHWLLW